VVDVARHHDRPARPPRDDLAHPVPDFAGLAVERLGVAQRRILQTLEEAIENGVVDALRTNAEIAGEMEEAAQPVSLPPVGHRLDERGVAGAQPLVVAAAAKAVIGVSESGVHVDAAVLEASCAHARTGRRDALQAFGDDARIGGRAFDLEPERTAETADAGATVLALPQR